MMATLRHTGDQAPYGLAQWQPDISLLIERQSQHDGHRVIETVPVLAGETVGSVRLLLSRSKPWFNTQSVLVRPQPKHTRPCRLHALVMLPSSSFIQSVLATSGLQV